MAIDLTLEAKLTDDTSTGQETSSYQTSIFEVDGSLNPFLRLMVL